MMHIIARRAGGIGYPYSRDFAQRILCKNTRCICNDQNGECASPALCSIGTDGRCEFFYDKQLKPPPDDTPTG